MNNGFLAMKYTIAVGQKILEDLYGVEYSELDDDNQDEIGEQVWADMMGFGFNGVQK
jgi:hypothetical protein